MNRSILLLAALAIGVNSLAEADDCQTCACQRCGCQSQCRKVCRVVCEMKEVKEVCYTCKCEDFCVPGPSTKCGEVYECDSCGSAGGCRCFDCLLAGHHGHCRTVWKPSCKTRLFSRNKLYKHEIKKQVPTYKWVVEYCCDECQCVAPCSTSADTHPASASAKPSSSESSAPSPAPPAELDMPRTADQDNAYAAKPVLPWTRLFK